MRKEAGAPLDSGLMTYEEAAAYLTIAEKTLRNWISNHRCAIPRVKLNESPRAPVRFRKSDLDAWIERQIKPAQIGGEL